MILAVVGSAPLQSQIPELPTISESWNEVSYPIILWSPKDGITVGLSYGQTEPMGYEDFDRPERYHASVSIDGQISSSGRKDLTTAFRFPRMVPGWRFSAVFKAYTHPHDQYFGIGNASSYIAANVTPAQEQFYEVGRSTTVFRGEVQRVMVGNLRALGGFNIQRWRLELPDGPSALAVDQAADVVSTVGQTVHDSYARLGLVFDSRDDEVVTRRGVKLEAIYGVGDYTRVTGAAMGFVPLGARTVIAARAVGQRMSGDPPLQSWYAIDSSDDPYEGLGGGVSHRAYSNLRFLGRHKLFGSFDVRYDIFRVETLINVAVLGFVDAGRVFEGEEFTLTTEGMHVGGGGGLFIRWGRGGVMGVTGAGGDDGAVFHFSTRWAF